MNVPIFDRGVAHDVQTQARLALDAATLRREALEESVEYDVRGALLDHEAARALFDVAGARVEAADAALAVVQDRYEAGAGTFAELLAARAEAAAAARDRVVAHHQALRAAFVLAWAVGAE